MARKAMIEKSNKTPKFSTRARNRCKLCGRPRAYMRFFEMCRLCFRKNALLGVLPGIKKASW
jgi:small subunit ribosomal protein S14